MAKYTVNEAAVEYARTLITSRRYVLKSDWGSVQPDTDQKNEYLKRHTWNDYGRWHLGLTTGATDETKGRYAFGFGDLTRLHRTGLIACVYRAAEWNHKAIELAAHDLLQQLDQRTTRRKT
jgi:hypothetical protein